VVEEHTGQPYRVATVEALEDSLGDESALDDARKKVMAAVAQASDGPAVLVMQPELSHDVFANALCQTLALTPVERQSLLDCDTILQRYSRLVEILEFKKLEQTLGRGSDSKVH
jgi:Lon protease-like protein